MGLIADVAIVNVDFKKDDGIKGRDAEEKERERCAEREKGRCTGEKKENAPRRERIRGSGRKKGGTSGGLRKG